MITRETGTYRHIAEMEPLLREADVQEIEAAAGLSPIHGLTRSVALSDVCYAVLKDGIPGILYGAMKAHPKANIGMVWLLASDELEKHPIQFCRTSRKWIDDLHDEVGCKWLFNYADARNTVHLNWCDFVGFDVSKDTYPYGPYNMPFHRIIREKK